jgi:hypothetical protein
MSTTPNVLNMANLMNGMSPMLALATQKDSRWLTLEVCREFQRNKCSRTENECKFAHPPPQVEVQNGRVTACFDSIKGKCQRKDPPCKYLHPPQHLREQLLANGRNNLILKNTAAILAAQQAHVVSAQVPYHQAIISATGLQPQVSTSPASSLPMFSTQGGLLAPQFNPYLSSAHGHTAALSLHSLFSSALVPHAHQSSNQPTSAATQGYTHQQPPQGQSDGSTAQHQLVQQQINVIPSPAIVNAQKLQRTDRLENLGETNPMEAALAVAHKAAAGGQPENSHNVIQTLSTVDNNGSVSSMGNSLVSTSSPRPTSAPSITTDSISTQQEHAALTWNQFDATHAVPHSDANLVSAQLPICVVGKKRPCDPMSDVINSHGGLPGHSGAYLNNALNSAVTFSPSGLPPYMNAGNFSPHHHAKNTAIIQTTLLSSHQPIMQQNNIPGLGHPVAKRPALADAKSGVPVYPQPAAANSASYQQAAALAAMQLQQTAASAQQNAFVPVSFTGHPPGLPRF